MSVGRTTPYRARIHDESPWYASILPMLERFDALGRFPTAEELSALHRERVEAQGLPALRFVEVPRAKPRRPKGPIDPRTLYEGRVIDVGEVPTRRDDWHDLFNALAFITFPRAKRALHARQYAAIKARLSPTSNKLPNARTREQDALSLFDEGGLAVATSAPCPAEEGALIERFASGRARAVPFGHALFEHLVARAPLPLATPYVVVLSHDALFGDDWLTSLDQALAIALAAPTAFVEPNPERGVSLDALYYARS